MSQHNFAEAQRVWDAHGAYGWTSESWPMYSAEHQAAYRAGYEWKPLEKTS